MRIHRMRVIAAVALVLVTLTAAAHASQKSRPVPRGAARPTLPSETFSVSGFFTGAVASGMVVNGTGLQLAPEAVVYEIGRGVVPQGTFFRDRMVCLSGTQVGNTLLVRSVMVRPPVDARILAGDASNGIREKDPNSPR